MATAPMIPPVPAEVRTVLRTISWETYRRLADENQSKATRFAFFDGVLEIMTVSAIHEFWVRQIEALSRNSLEKVPLFAALGIAEVWRFFGGRLLIYRLTSGRYKRVANSKFLPGVAATQLAQLLADSESMSNPAWMDRVHRTTSR